MSRSVIVAAVVGLTVLAGCGDANEPSAPPTSEDALTTTSAAPDVSEETTEAALTSEAPEEAETSDAPAMEQTEEGAEAFVEHYFELLNDAHQGRVQVAEFRTLATDECQTCAAFADAAETAPFGEPYVEVVSAAALLLDEEAQVEVQLEQLSDGVIVDSVVSLEWGDKEWRVSSVQAASQ